MPIPGPDIDPAGWMTLTTSLHGDFFAQRSVEIICLFSLAEPLEFPRGYPIPFTAEISCADTQLIDILATQPASLSPTLIRQFKGSDGPDDTMDMLSSTRSWITHRGTGRLHLAGEIHAPASLPLSFCFAGTAVQYYIRYAVQAPGLQVRPQYHT
ncbi:hypothetical protein AURDEDRAFT_162153 [Auricularia subglabra TFB-10046 SS5]|nr:hypothetical protein AURDEDRAFT_162153 [Auricularia subglabra TFB-10046 SS5]